MSLAPKSVLIPPITISLDGAKVTIVEVLDMSITDFDRMYLVSCYVEYRGYRSKVFHLLVRSNSELLAKLRAEIAKMKLFLWMKQTHLFEKAAK